MSRSTWRSHATAARRGVLPAAVVTGLLAGLLAAPAQASRTVSESYPVPSSGTYALTGHGYGHGHGMSQHGARGAAKQGLGYQQILAFYYPGTVLATTTGTIRVLISADTDNEVSVLPATGLRVRDTRSGATYALPTTSGIKTWRLRTVGGATVLDYDDGTWHTYRPGGAALTGAGEFYGPSNVTLRVGGTTRAYRGALRLSSSDTVNVLSLDDYVKGVVPREMPASWEAAAVRAQAVAARTYAAWDRSEHPNRHYDTCDTTSCQVYGGVGDEDARGNAAVAATANQVLNHQGQPAFTQIGSSSGGWLSAGSRPYLVAKADPYDGYTGNSVHTWTTTLTRAAVQKAYPSLGTLQRVLVTRRDGNGDWYGRVEQLVLDGSKADVTVSGATFRSTFGLRSEWFRLGSATTPAAATTPTPATSAITTRWAAMGGNRSRLGRPTGNEYAVGTGRARNFQHGRIYATSTTGAHELYGKVLRAYVRRGAATSPLGFPRTAPRRFARGTLAVFEKGVLRVFRSGRVTVVYTR
jgi:stage II sporulation protein D